RGPGRRLPPLKDRGHEAEEAYGRALSLQKELAALPGRPDCRRELGRTYNNLGILLATRGAPAAVDQVLQQALEVRRQLAHDFPDVPLYQWDLARTCNNRATWLERTNPQEAEKAYRDVLAILAVLAADYPRVPRYRQELAAGHNNLGRLLRDQHRTAE